MNRLSEAAPASQTLLAQAAARGDNMGTVTASLLRLLERYGAAELQLGIEAALAAGVPHPNAVRLALERQAHGAQRATAGGGDPAKACAGARQAGGAA
jgi:hypothetical protein